MPTRDARRDDDLRQEIAALVQSRYWKLLRRWLVNRRQQLFREEPATTETLWKNRGALFEVDNLLHAPELALLQMARLKHEPLAEDLEPPFKLRTGTEPL